MTTVGTDVAKDVKDVDTHTMKDPDADDETYVRDAENVFGVHEDIPSFLRTYHDLLGGHIREGETELYRMARAYASSTFGYDVPFDEPPTAYEIFVLIEKLTAQTVCAETFMTVDAYDALPMGTYSEWDPMRPPDDTDQYPGDECVDIRIVRVSRDTSTSTSSPTTTPVSYTHLTLPTN